MPKKLSIIIPIAPGDESISDLLADLSPIVPHCEILCVAAQPILALSKERHIITTVATRGRAQQLNHGCEKATGEWLWLLHADSRVSKETCEHVIQQLDSTAPPALYYGKLAFTQPQSWLMTLTAWGANLRSKLFHLPFGDQSFLLPRSLWSSVGPFDETAAYGEDHLFVWSAIQKKIPILSLEVSVLTSPRKYTNSGWLVTTVRHQYLFWRQAIPQFMNRRVT